MHYSGSGWLAGKGSSKHLCLKCQQLGLVSPSPTDPPKSCQLQLVGSMPYSSWKMQYPVEIVLCPRGLLRKSTFANIRAKLGTLLLPHNKILLPLLAPFLTFSSSLLRWVLERNAWYGFFSCIFLSSQTYDPHFLPLHCVITEGILVSRCRNEN